MNVVFRLGILSNMYDLSGQLVYLTQTKVNTLRKHCLRKKNREYSLYLVVHEVAGVTCIVVGEPSLRFSTIICSI